MAEVTDNDEFKVLSLAIMLRGAYSRGDQYAKQVAHRLAAACVGLALAAPTDEAVANIIVASGCHCRCTVHKNHGPVAASYLCEQRGED